MAEKLKIRSLNVNGIQCLKKRALVFTELEKYNNEIILLQETHTCIFDETNFINKWGSNIYFSHGATNSKGVCIIFPKNFKGSSELIYSDLEGRILMVKFSLEKEEYILCNVYCPVSSAETEQLNTLDKLNTELLDYINDKLIICGDWNVTMNNQLDKKSEAINLCTNITYREHLKNFLNEYEMSDCWRVVHPGKKQYTCRSGKKGKGATLSRIDMIFIKDSLLNRLLGATIEPGFMSDHNYTLITIKTGSNIRGRGSWKFNNNLLKDKEYIRLIKDLIRKEIAENDHYEDKGFLWDYLKMRIRSDTMIYTGQIQKIKRENEKRLKDELIRLDTNYMDNPTDETFQELQLIKKEAEDINKEKLAGSIFRSKCEWAEDGEKSSKFFLNLEKHNYVNKQITMLEVGEEVITDEKQILVEIREYYKNLYSSNQAEHRKLEEILKDIPKLTDEQRQLTKGLITYDECLKALKGLANGKTPGTDGITADFYKFFWNDISEVVVNSINYAFQKNEMSMEQRTGLISLSPKKNKKRTLLKNWRPITLLNVDYKILAKALAMRLKTILPDYIDESQFGYVKDRYIGENIRCLIDLNTLCRKDDTEAYAIQIDFEKAFDSVNWDFMLLSLEKMNFDPDYVNWVKILYKNTSSSVLNNGHKTDVFDLRRGVHQGCPLSALLFIILVQVLQQMLKNANDISGIKVGGKELKILQMPDDTTILTSSIDDVPKILEILQDFYEISGLKTNVDKTIAYKLGRNPDFNFPLDHLGLTWGKLPINLLGLTISDDDEVTKAENFSTKIEGIDVLTKIWCRRNLSMKGKLSIINTLLIPKLIYPCTILDVPQDIITTAMNTIRTFFWNWKRPKIRLETLIRKIDNGGIKYPCLDCKVKAWKTLWAIRALKFEKNDPLWVRIVNELLPEGITFYYLLKCKPNKKILDTYCPNLPSFYKNILINWAEVNKSTSYQTKETIRNECLWLNQEILVKNKPLYCEQGLRNNVYLISDILDNENIFMSHIDINRKHGTRYTFLDILRLRLTIPHDWRKILSNEIIENVTDEGLFKKLKKLEKLKTNDIYWIILNNNHDCETAPNAQTYWQRNYNIDDETIKKIYRLPYICTKRTMLQALQYKITYKIINCNYWLHKIKIIDNPKCRFCQEEDKIEHFFYSCENTKNFWHAFRTWWNVNADFNIKTLEEKEVLLGKIDEEENKVLNCCMLIGKSMIYKQKNLNKEPDIYQFHCELKEYIQIEKQIATNQNKLDSISDEWGDIWNI